MLILKLWKGELPPPKIKMLRELIAFFKKDSIILNQAKKKKSVVYGARALNKQVLGAFKRRTIDWDIYTKKPKQSAKQLEKKLDKEAGKDIYYVKKALYPKTIKVMHKGLDARKGTKDDFGVVDYTKQPKNLVKKKIQGIYYVPLKIIKKDKLRILKSKKFAFRHSKDREDLNIIKSDKTLKKLGL